MLHTMNFKSQFLGDFKGDRDALSFLGNERLERLCSSRLIIETAAVKCDCLKTDGPQGLISVAVVCGGGSDDSFLFHVFIMLCTCVCICVCACIYVRTSACQGQHVGSRVNLEESVLPFHPVGLVIRCHRSSLRTSHFSSLGVISSLKKKKFF